MSSPLGLQAFNIPKELRRDLDRVAADLGLLSATALLRFLVTMHDDGLLMVANKAVKDAFQGASEERILKMVKRVAEETVRYELWNEGYRATPYAE